jgi:acetyltransferase-like isoleucine patch superfamily enzyme
MVGLFHRLRYWWQAPRIGADMPLTHWMLHFPGLGRWLAERKLAQFGAGSSLRPFCNLVRTDRIEIGERVVIRPQTIIMANDIARIIIGNDVLIGSGVHFYAANHSYDSPDKPIAMQGHSDAEDLVIEDDVWIGAGAIILPGVRIGRHSVVAAGSVVTTRVEPFSVYAGVPARKIKDISG